MYDYGLMGSKSVNTCDNPGWEAMNMLFNFFEKLATEERGAMVNCGETPFEGEGVMKI